MIRTAGRRFISRAIARKRRLVVPIVTPLQIEAFTMKSVPSGRVARRVLRRALIVAVFACFSLVAASVSVAAARMPKIFGDNMVLQRDAQNAVWGWANPREKVVVEVNGIQKATVADEYGYWLAQMPPQPAGGPYEFNVRASNSIKFKNVYFGEVWVCAGQSNMTFPLKKEKEGSQESSTARYPQLRVFTVPQRTADDPVNDVDSKWTLCSPETSRDYSAVAYYFGRLLHEKLQVPVGIIVAAADGSTCEAWTNPTALQKYPELASLLSKERLAKTPDVQKVGALFHAMISPIVPYSIKGVVWYQGESNANRAWQYRTLFPLLISNWREEWGQGDFPFYFVQLPNFMARKPNPGNSAWAELREAQHRATAERNVAEVVAIDLGDALDFHPKNKRAIGERLANTALANSYGFDVMYTGPIFRSMTIKDSNATLTFSEVDGSLKIADELDESESDVVKRLRGFAIAGADRKFYWADAEIKKDVVVVSSPNVPQPVAVRYAWADNPDCNLTDESGVPASPFRTDEWAGVTLNAN